MIHLNTTYSQYTDPDIDPDHLNVFFHVRSSQRRTPSMPSTANVALRIFSDSAVTFVFFNQPTRESSLSGEKLFSVGHTRYNSGTCRGMKDIFYRYPKNTLSYRTPERSVHQQFGIVRYVKPNVKVTFNFQMER